MYEDDDFGFESVDDDAECWMSIDELVKVTPGITKRVLRDWCKKGSIDSRKDSRGNWEINIDSLVAAFAAKNEMTVFDIASLARGDARSEPTAEEDYYDDDDKDFTKPVFAS